MLQRVVVALPPERAWLRPCFDDEVVGLAETLKPGGRVILATNAADHGRRLYDIHAAAAQELGHAPDDPPGIRFTLDDFQLVRSVFPDAQLHLLPNAFVFPTARAALDYGASRMVDSIRERTEDGRHRTKLLPLVEARIQATIELEGTFRVPKDAGCFVADV